MRRRPPSGEPSWLWRRLFALAVLAFACWRLVALESAPDTRVAETIAWGWILLLASVALGYLGFATVQDVAAIFATRSGTPYAPAATADTEEPSRSPSQQPPRDFAG